MITRIVARIISAVKLARVMGLNLKFFIIPSFLLVLSAAFDGASMALLAPLGQGIIEGNFDFLENSLIFERIISNTFIKFSTTLDIFSLLLFMIFVCVLMKVVFRYSAGRIINNQNEKFVSELRNKIYRKYLALDKSYFDKNNTGKLSNVLISFTESIGDKMKYLYDLLRAGLILVAYFIIMLFISWQITLISLLVFPVIYFLLVSVLKNIKKTSRAYADVQQSLSHRINNILSNISLVKLYSKEEEERRIFNWESEKLKALKYSMLNKNLLIPQIQEMIVITSLIMLVLLIALFIFSENIGMLASFIVFFILLKRCSLSINEIGFYLGVIIQADGPLRQIISVLKEDELKISCGSEVLKGFKKSLEFRNLNFRYDKSVPVLKNISLEFKKGEVTALVGPSGSGKTTIASLLLRFYDCNENEIFIDGKDIKRFSLDSIRQHMALVSQETLLINDTLRRNILFGLNNVSDTELMNAVKKAKLEDLVGKLPEGLDTMIGDRGAKLSGGERQRIAIARALLKKSEILILDEATSSLDSRTESLIQEAIEEAINSKTAIVIAHRLSTIKNADKIAVIENGHIVEHGTFKELIKNKDKFYEYWQEQKFS